MTHHEKWGGSGYPAGLKGKEIPLVGQIVSIADVFDALTTKRPYKKPFRVEKPGPSSSRGKGCISTPRWSMPFFAIKDEILDTKQRYQESSKNRPFKFTWHGIED